MTSERNKIWWSNISSMCAYGSLGNILMTWFVSGGLLLPKCSLKRNTTISTTLLWCTVQITLFWFASAYLCNCSTLFPGAPSGLNDVISKSFSKKSTASEISEEGAAWSVNGTHAFGLGRCVLAFLFDVSCPSRALRFSTVCISGPIVRSLQPNLVACDVGPFIAL